MNQAVKTKMSNVVQENIPKSEITEMKRICCKIYHKPRCYSFNAKFVISSVR